MESSTLENRWESEQKKAERQGELPGQHESRSHHGASWVLHQSVHVGDARHHQSQHGGHPGSGSEGPG